MTTPAELWLFSYGTLREPHVQLATFGRRLESVDDALVGYALSMLKITDPAVVAISGSAEHPILRATGNPGDSIAGLALRVSEADLEKADRYEVADYRRVPATLRSGRRAFVYVAAQSG